MSNTEFFLIKNDKEELSNLEIVKSSTLEFQSEKNTESLSGSSSSHNSSPDHKKEENSDDNNTIIHEIEEFHILPKNAESSRAASSSSSEEKELKEEDDPLEDGFRTPTSLDHKISVALTCPPAPRKTKPSLKRKAPYYNHCNCRHPLDLSKEVELLFPAQHFSLSDSHQSIKKIRREGPK